MKCYDCKFRGTIHNSVHTRCLSIGGNDLMVKLFKSGHIKFNNEHGNPLVKMKEWGVKNNWANWPTDFDPLWVEKCELFEEKKIADVKVEGV